MGLTSDDIKAIWASARKIYRDASFLRDGNRRHDLTMEALAIMTLCEAAIGKQQIEVELDNVGTRDIPS
jgi:hypothetical protein